mmetsp:Transcript_2582/g.8105  ORF Transcript_2582/g.8105 Transcript_2582/m.8105 type:complete len:260 (-) Transcript_2582:22-801(-)
MCGAARRSTGWRVPPSRRFPSTGCSSCSTWRRRIRHAWRRRSTTRAAAPAPTTTTRAAARTRARASAARARGTMARAAWPTCASSGLTLRASTRSTRQQTCYSSRPPPRSSTGPAARSSPSRAWAGSEATAGACGASDCARGACVPPPARCVRRELPRLARGAEAHHPPLSRAHANPSVSSTLDGPIRSAPRGRGASHATRRRSHYARHGRALRLRHPPRSRERDRGLSSHHTSCRPQRSHLSRSHLQLKRHENRHSSE